jgi:hypothetical protein
VLAGLVVAGVLGCSGSAWAATYTVTNLNDSGPGSLRAAIGAAVPGDTVDATGVSGTITLTSGAISFPVVIGELGNRSALSIIGPGPGKLAISGAGQSQIFSMPQFATVSISGLAFENGYGADGGAISDSEDDLSGYLTLTLTNDAFTDNTAASPGGVGLGGAVYFEADGVDLNTQLTIINSTFTANSAGGAGGDAAGGSRGDGSGEGVGGAVYSGDGIMLVSGSTFADNTAGGAGGVGAYSGYGQGGAVADMATVSNDIGLSVTNSTFVGNVAGGVAGAGTDSGVGQGGALYALQATPSLSSDTIDANSVGSASGGSGSGVWWSGPMIAQGTIVADNTGAANCDSHVGSGSAFNLEDPGGDGSCGFDLPAADPQLGTLQSNGGPTQTQALSASSPAVDAIPAADCPTPDAGVDQRGLPRPSTGSSFCDVGAFELQDTTQTTLSCPSVAIALGAGSPGCTATVAPTEGSGAGTPAGKVVYTVYSDAACTVPSTGSATVTLGAGGTVPGFAAAGVPAGTRYVQATFAPASSPAPFGLQGSASACVPLTVTQAAVTLSSAVKDASTGTAWAAGGEPAGATAQDTVTLGATVAGFPAGGTVTFALYDDTTCTGSTVSAQTVNVGGGMVPASAVTGALSAGSYGYLASYSGDANYTPPAGGTCEPFTVNAVKVPNLADVKVAISGGPAGAADGTTFTENIVVTNAGPATASDVVTALIVPSGVTVTTAAGAATLGPILDWTASTIAANATKTYTVTFKVGPHAGGPALFGVAAASLQTPDPAYGNNAAAAIVQLGSAKAPARRAVHERNPLALGHRLVPRLRQLTHHTRHNHRR